jgi:hypothetical protein
MTHSSRIVWPLFYTGRDRSSAAETPDGRFHNSIGQGGPAAQLDRVGGLGAEIGNGAALWTGDRAGAWPDALDLLWESAGKPPFP